MREHFRVGIGSKICVAVLNELFLQRLVIFDDPVVNERDFAGSVKMRMCVLVVYFSMRRPTGVTDSIRSGRRFLRNQFGKRGDPAGAFSCFDVIAVDDRDPGGIVAAIFEATKTVEQNWGGL